MALVRLGDQIYFECQQPAGTARSSMARHLPPTEDKRVNDALISRLSIIVERACAASKNRFGMGIWTHHVKPMLDVAAELAKRIEADPEIVAIAVLLHDYAGIADQNKAQDHHVHGATEADRILSLEKYPHSRIEQVKACILTHRGSVSLSRDTKEQQCVADADAIVHIQCVPSLFFVAYSNLGMTIDEGHRWVRDKLERDWEKLSDTGKDYIQSRYEAARMVLE